MNRRAARGRARRTRAPAHRRGEREEEPRDGRMGREVVRAWEPQERGALRVTPRGRRYIIGTTSGWILKSLFARARGVRTVARSVCVFFFIRFVVDRGSSVGLLLWGGEFQLD